MIAGQVVEKGKWNSFAVRQPFFSLLQSWEWGEFKQLTGWKVFRVAVEEGGEITAGAQLLIKTMPAGLASFAYVPRGPLCDWQDRDTTNILLNEIHRLAGLHRAVFLKIEPPILNAPANDQALRSYSFLPSRYHNQPRNTIVVHLDRDLEELLSQMHPKTRYHIRRAERKGVAVSIGERRDLTAFNELMRYTGQRKRFAIRSREYYELEWEVLSQSGQCALFLARYENELIGVHFAVRFGSQAAYFHGGSLDKAKNVSSNYLLMWEAIKWAKASGCEIFDLWGIPDEIEGSVEQDQEAFLERKDGLWGVYRFKSGFSKNVVSYAGAYDFVYKPFAYAALSRLLVSRDKVERLAARLESRRKPLST